MFLVWGYELILSRVLLALRSYYCCGFSRGTMGFLFLQSYFISQHPCLSCTSEPWNDFCTWPRNRGFLLVSFAQMQWVFTSAFLPQQIKNCITLSRRREKGPGLHHKNTFLSQEIDQSFMLAPSGVCGEEGANSSCICRSKEVHTLLPAYTWKPSISWLY